MRAGASLPGPGHGPASDRDAAAALGELFLYPRQDYRHLVTAARALCDAQCCVLTAQALVAFENAVGELSLDELQDLYTRTFDLTPRCVPYLSVHLFGAESFDRGRLMTGLDEAYRRACFDRGSELPDHLGLVLRFATAFDETEWDELVTLCLARPLALMLGELQEAGNPFRHAVEAVRRALGVAHLEAEAPRVPLWRRRRRRRGSGEAPGDAP
jgi:nitrate reductase delta subunit